MQKFKKEDRTIPGLVIGMEGEHEFHLPKGLELDNYGCFGITGRHDRVLCLKVLLDNGSLVLIQYGRMATPISFDGKKKITVEAPPLRLEIKGANLAPLMDFLGEQRLSWIKSAQISSDTDAFMAKNGEPEIEAIEIRKQSQAAE